MQQQTKVKVARLQSTDEKAVLKIKVGNGQPSATTIYKNGSKLTELTEPYKDYELGTCKSLIGTEFLFTTSVHDIEETPNQTLVTHLVKNDSGQIVKTEFDIPVEEGEVAICSTQVYFLKK